MKRVKRERDKANQSTIYRWSTDKSYQIIYCAQKYIPKQKEKSITM